MQKYECGCPATAQHIFPGWKALVATKPKTIVRCHSATHSTHNSLLGVEQNITTVYARQSIPDNIFHEAEMRYMNSGMRTKHKGQRPGKEERKRKKGKRAGDCGSAVAATDGTRLLSLLKLTPVPPAVSVDLSQELTKHNHIYSSTPKLMADDTDPTTDAFGLEYRVNSALPGVKATRDVLSLYEHQTGFPHSKGESSGSQTPPRTLRQSSYRRLVKEDVRACSAEQAHIQWSSQVDRLLGSDADTAISVQGELCLSWS